LVAHRLDRFAGGDAPEEADLRGTGPGRRIGELDPTLLVPVPAQEALALEQLQMLVHGAVGSEPETLADLAMRRRVTLLAAEVTDELEDLLLARRQVVPGRRHGH